MSSIVATGFNNFSNTGHNSGIYRNSFQTVSFVMPKKVETVSHPEIACSISKPFEHEFPKTFAITRVAISLKCLLWPKASHKSQFSKQLANAIQITNTPVSYAYTMIFLEPCWYA